MSARLTVADVLDRAADLIEPEGAWTQRWSARDANGNGSWSLAPQSVCWCMGGAIIKAAGADDEVSTAAYRLMCSVTGTVVTWNDAPERTQTEVVAKLREAAALAREQGA